MASIFVWCVLWHWFTTLQSCAFLKFWHQKPGIRQTCRDRQNLFLSFGEPHQPEGGLPVRLGLLGLSVVRLPLLSLKPAQCLGVHSIFSRGVAALYSTENQQKETGLQVAWNNDSIKKELYKNRREKKSQLCFICLIVHRALSKILRMLFCVRLSPFHTGGSDFLLCYRRRRLNVIAPGFNLHVKHKNTITQETTGQSVSFSRVRT